MNEKTYLGDGVYAEFDGYHIWIWTSKGIEDSAKIALEDVTFNKLHAFAARHWNMSKSGIVVR